VHSLLSGEEREREGIVISVLCVDAFTAQLQSFTLCYVQFFFAVNTFAFVLFSFKLSVLV
jgi:hypothetical protein